MAKKKVEKLGGGIGAVVARGQAHMNFKTLSMETLDQISRTHPNFLVREKAKVAYANRTAGVPWDNDVIPGHVTPKGKVIKTPQPARKRR
jgi:hypothetical protein